MLYSDIRSSAAQLTDNWWMFLVAGVGWLIIAAIVLRMDLTSVTTVGVLLGVIFLVSGIEEIMVASAREHWRWLRALMGVVFIVGALWCFSAPFNAFWSIAAAFGLLLIFKGVLDITYSVASQAVNGVWWLGLLSGILEIVLGFWASQQYYPARAALLLLYVGFYGIFRGISDLVLAFQVRSLNSAVS
jgi:uncharacterized membrane protein HdeD (DUF308 family)